ncbi:MAG: phage holin family protein [Prevotella sp.]|nr:phage holin family protein [Prevotella sp.]MCM1074953.1 phage holin family protein [Ruminococcus sp.]
MKTTFMDQLKELIELGKRYLKLQTDCIRLEAAEKTTLLISGLAIGLICILVGALTIVLLAMAAVCAFGTFLEPWLAYLCVAGCLLLIVAILLVFRKVLIINPIAKMITKLFCPKEP